MKLSVRTSPAAESSADLLAVPLARSDGDEVRLPARVAALDRAAGGCIAAVIAAGDFRGKRGQTLLLHGPQGIAARRLLLVGLGAEAGIDGEALRKAAAAAVAAAAAPKGRKLALLAPALRGL